MKTMQLKRILTFVVVVLVGLAMESRAQRVFPQILNNFDSYNTYMIYGIFNPNTMTNNGQGDYNTACPALPIYDPVAKGYTLCCNNRLTNISISQYVVGSGGGLVPLPIMPFCCGNSAYFANEYFCCSNTLYALSSSSNSLPGCCSGIYYNRSAQACFNGILYPAQYGPTTTTCGLPVFVNFTYNFPTQIDSNSGLCCDGKIISLARTRNWNSSADSNYVSCCGSNGYNVRSQICCEGDVYDRNNFTQPACCRNQIYDFSTMICCNGYVYPLHPTINCCGVNAYNTTIQKCCGGYIFSIPGGETKKNNKCCGIAAYDSEKQMCCTGVIINISSNGKACCGFKPYDTHTHVCCNQEYLVYKYESCSERERDEFLLN